MCLFEIKAYNFDWWMGIRGKRVCPLTRGVRFLECPLIRDFTSFVCFPFSRAWAGNQCSFSDLPLSFPKHFCLCDMMDSEWNGTGEISYYFAYQRAKLFTGNKITYTISLYLQNTQYMSSSPKQIGNEMAKILGTCHPQFLATL